MNGWFFLLMPLPATTPKAALVTWFKQMSQALDGAKVEISAADQAVQQVVQDLMKNFNVRLPKTPEEE